ncbi:hypothetical protein GGI43DRAFT_93180 [Trichoderma evansii]
MYRSGLGPGGCVTELGGCLGSKSIRYRYSYRYSHRQKCLSVWCCWGLIPRTDKLRVGLFEQTGSSWGQNQEPGYQVRLGTAPPAGNDGYPRCGGSTRLVTTPEIARVPFPGFNLLIDVRCGMYLLVLRTPDISSMPRSSSLDQPGIDSFRFSSLSPTSSVSLRPLHLLLPPLAASFASFFSHLLLAPSPSWGSRAFICASPPTFCLAPRSGSFTLEKTPSNHPSIPPCPSSWPRLASPALTSHNPPSCRYYWTTRLVSH